MFRDIKKVYSNMFVFSGRSPRREYWKFQAPHYTYIGIAVIVWLFLDGKPGFDKIADYALYSFIAVNILVFTLPGVSVTIRRFHDCGKSGWFYLLFLLGWIGVIAVMAICAQSGELGPNRYGDNPYGYPCREEVMNKLLSLMDQWRSENPDAEVDIVNNPKMDVISIIKYDRRKKIKSPLIRSMIDTGNILGFKLE